MSDLILSETQKLKYREWARTHECTYRYSNESIRRSKYAANGYACIDTFHISHPSPFTCRITVECACGATIDLS